MFVDQEYADHANLAAAARTPQRWSSTPVTVFYSNTTPPPSLHSAHYIPLYSYHVGQHAAAAEEAYQRRREEAATVVQLAWRSRSMRVYLFGRFEASPEISLRGILVVGVHSPELEVGARYFSKVVQTILTAYLQVGEYCWNLVRLLEL